jgi:hypothetical protein
LRRCNPLPEHPSPPIERAACQFLDSFGRESRLFCALHTLHRGKAYARYYRGRGRAAGLIFGPNPLACIYTCRADPLVAGRCPSVDRKQSSPCRSTSGSSPGGRLWAGSKSRAGGPVPNYELMGMGRAAGGRSMPPRRAGGVRRRALAIIQAGAAEPPLRHPGPYGSVFGAVRELGHKLAFGGKSQEFL